jgi:hypothetical protein
MNADRCAPSAAADRHNPRPPRGRRGRTDRRMQGASPTARSVARSSLLGTSRAAWCERVVAVCRAEERKVAGAARTPDRCATRPFYGRQNRASPIGTERERRGVLAGVAAPGAAVRGRPSARLGGAIRRSGRDGADLLHQAKEVHAHPALGQRAVLDPADVDVVGIVVGRGLRALALSAVVGVRSLARPTGVRRASSGVGQWGEVPDSLGRASGADASSRSE